jgi:tetraacyldisaccharide 4'-kinase
VSPEGEERELSSLQGKTVYAFSGIANPAYFQSTLEAAGAGVREFRSFRDHHRYTQKDMDRIAADSGEGDVITTEKDLVKLRGIRCPARLWALRVEFSVTQDFYDALFSIIKE